MGPGSPRSTSTPTRVGAQRSALSASSVTAHTSSGGAAILDGRCDVGGGLEEVEDPALIDGLAHRLEVDGDPRHDADVVVVVVATGGREPRRRRGVCHRLGAEHVLARGDAVLEEPVRGDDGGPDHLLPTHHLVHGELAAMDHELEREVVRAVAGAAPTGGPRRDLGDRVPERLVDAPNVREELVGRLVGLAVEEEAVAADVAHVPAARLHLDDAVEEMARDLLCVLDADVRQKARVAPDVGQQKGPGRHGPSDHTRGPRCKPARAAPEGRREGHGPYLR
jgi:hypothetical protein